LSNLGGTEEAEEKRTGLLRVVDNGARQGDSHGSDVDALDLLERGLQRFADASAVEHADALLYRAEIAVRLGDCSWRVRRSPKRRRCHWTTASLLGCTPTPSLQCRSRPSR
jgi:hypothetical protein